MATSRTDIVNQALVKLKSPRINNIDTDSTEEAVQARLIFQKSLDYLLQSNEWSFATIRTSLARLDETPEFEYNYIYSLPSNPYCIQVRNLYPIGLDFKVEGRKVFTSEESVNISYIKRVTDMNDLPATFVEAFVFYLASELALPLTGNVELGDKMFKKFEYTIRKARHLDSKQNTARTISDGDWINCR
jgi:hypothetical protein